MSLNHSRRRDAIWCHWKKTIQTSNGGKSRGKRDGNMTFLLVWSSFYTDETIFTIMKKSWTAQIIVIRQLCNSCDRPTLWWPALIYTVSSADGESSIYCHQRCFQQYQCSLAAESFTDRVQSSLLLWMKTSWVCRSQLLPWSKVLITLKLEQLTVKTYCFDMCLFHFIIIPLIWSPCSYFGCPHLHSQYN